MSVARQRLLHQRIGEGKLKSPVDVVQWLLAVQSQDFAGAKWSLGARMSHASDARVEAAFNNGEILRTHLLRPTWHFVTPKDIHWLLKLSGPRVGAFNASYYRKVGLEPPILARCNKVLGKALAGHRFLNRHEIRALFTQNKIDTTGELRLSFALMHAELEGVICSGPRIAKQFTYALLGERAQPGVAYSRDEALAELARRYFLSRGPATVHDCAKWSGMTVGDIRKGVEAVSAELRVEAIDGHTYYSSVDALPSAARKPKAFLLSIFDEFVSSYKDRSALMHPTHGKHFVGMGNALTAIVVLDAQIVGSWKRSIKKNGVSISMDILRKLSKAEQGAVDRAIDDYCTFLELPAV